MTAGTESAAPHGDEATGDDFSTLVPTEVVLLDYDRELAYLQQEGRLRKGMRPSGFKE